jgi:hypothetical protein
MENFGESGNGTLRNQASDDLRLRFRTNQKAEDRGIKRGMQKSCRTRCNSGVLEAVAVNGEDVLSARGHSRVMTR